MKLAIGGDRSGYPLKVQLIETLKKRGHEVNHFGTFGPDEELDFPDISQVVGDEILAGRAERGILVCGTGVGACIAGNKIPGIRAALCHDIYSAHQCVEHDDVNLLCLGAQIIGVKLAEEIVDAFLKAEFSTEEHFRRRVRKLADMERSLWTRRP
ncbi:MAG: ribose 5-phosphate isomerase B [Chloroflexi bacterium]|nr:ribose 5-phosphate isomerase B [Chloroflexota bacterium]